MTGLPDTQSYEILTVCTGNICRSPAAHLLLAEQARRLEGDRPSIKVSSAGTRALVNQGVHGPMDKLLAEIGVSSSGFVARQLSESDVAGADLILALTAEHKSLVVELDPVALRKTFTLGELAEICRQLDAGEIQAVRSGSLGERFRNLVGLASSHRGGFDVSTLDVPDPYRRSAEMYELSLNQIRTHLDVVFSAL